MEQNILHFNKMQFSSGDVDNKIDHRVTDVYMCYIQARITCADTLAKTLQSCIHDLKNI